MLNIEQTTNMQLNNVIHFHDNYVKLCWGRVYYTLGYGWKKLGAKTPLYVWMDFFIVEVLIRNQEPIGNVRVP